MKLVVFDFDQTLTVYHVFKSLAGWDRTCALGVPAPYATTEQGQVRRILELNKSAEFSRDGFATKAFGGESRVAEVRRQLASLQEANIELIVCTKGLIGTTRRILMDLNMIQFFGSVYGNAGETYGSAPYDQDTRCHDPRKLEPEIAEVLGPSQHADWTTKKKLIERLMREKGLQRKEVVLVEDDPEEIRQASTVCQTLYVTEQAGMGAKEFENLRRLGDMPPLPEVVPDIVSNASTRSGGCMIL